MTFVFDMILCMVFILLQTVIFPLLPFFNACCDLFLPLIVYMGLFRSFRDSIVSILVMGWVMDAVSGAPTGIYLSWYIWLFFIVYWFKGFLHIHSFVLLSLIVFLSAMMENILLLFISHVQISDWTEFSKITREMFVQLFSAAVFGPLIILWTTQRFEKMKVALGKRYDDF